MVEVTHDTSESLIYEYKEVEAVGPYFVKYISSFNKDLESGLEELSLSEQVDDSFVIDSNDDEYLRNLDPKEWKGQDHYNVLGLEHLRYKATPAIIKSAYRQKVLKHHPDKRKAKGEIVNRDNDYFTCITKAWEILGDKGKRRSYDSVDPFFDDSIPTNSEIAKHDFFELFRDVFEQNSRWSERKPVPGLGGVDDSRENVNKFYSFWYDFNSWREYSYGDEEVKEDGLDRIERRWIEKQNKAVRAKKKKEEMARIRNLVDLAYNSDPRIIKFKAEDKEKKEALKRAKAEALRARQEEAERIQKEAEEAKLKEKEKAAEEEAAKQKLLKAEREAQKKAFRKARKTLRDTCKDNGYYVNDQNDLVKHMEFCEKLCEMLSVKDMEDFNVLLKEGGKDVFCKKLTEVELKMNEERQKLLSATGNKQVNGKVINKSQYWSQSDINLLIKAVNLFPAGTAQRWEVVANFINQHGKNGHRDVTAKEVLSKAKELQTSDESNSFLKRVANQKAYDNFEKQKRVGCQVESSETSQRFNMCGDQVLTPPWTSEEQKLLEQALKTYPSNTEERWDRIAQCVPTRNKKECMKRYKDLVQMVKAKQEAGKCVTK